MALEILENTGIRSFTSNFSVDDDEKNLNLVIPIELTTEYVAGDVLIVSIHEGSDYGGSSILPRLSGHFEPISTTNDVSIGEVGFQRFWARTLTASEPVRYQFTRGDSESYYDAPEVVGFIVRGATLNYLEVTFSAPVTGENNLQVISSNPCGAVEGDLVYGYAHNESNYDKMYYVLDNTTPLVETEAFELCEDVFSTFTLVSPPANFTQGSIVSDGTQNVWRLPNTGAARHTRSGFAASAPIAIEIDFIGGTANFGFEFGGQYSGTTLQVYTVGSDISYFLTGGGGASFGSFTVGDKIRIRITSLAGTITATAKNLTTNTAIGTPFSTTVTFDGQFQFFNYGGTTDVHRFAAGYGNTIPPQESASFLWWKAYPYGVTSLREANPSDNGIVYFQHFSAGFDYKIFAARISSATEQEPEIEPLGPYEQFQGDLAPSSHQNPRGRAWNEASGKTKDQFIDAVTDAVQARFVQIAPPDALGLLASDRLLERYPQETDAIFRARIAGAWDVWEFAGTKYGLELVLLQAGWNCSIIEHWRTDSSIWAEFSVIVYAVAITSNPWGTGNWGIFAWGGNPQAIPTSSLRRLINKFKAGHSKIRELRIAAPNAFIWGQSAWGGTNPYSSSTII